MYVAATVFVISLFLGIYFLTPISSSTVVLQVIFIVVMGFATVLIAVTTIGFYRTKYVVKDGILRSWSPFAIIKLKLSDIEKVERTMIPFHFRFGASLYCGRFYVPNLGWVKAIITNLRDGLMITNEGQQTLLDNSFTSRKISRNFEYL